MAAENIGRKRSMERITPWPRQTKADTMKKTKRTTGWPHLTKADTVKTAESMDTVTEETEKKKRIERIAQCQNTTINGESTHRRSISTRAEAETPKGTKRTAETTTGTQDTDQTPPPTGAAEATTPTHGSD
jgi:hypothetical protein